ncbi:MAG: OmpA family protein [Akkermansia sp.]|nr:OmpA family protein [Akkermansia sp.]MBR2313567.1 OmpA family protein [Akkermansia sp.]
MNIPQRVGNRRRNGYELTRQRDMVPIAMGAACAAVVVHALLWVYFPSLSLLGLGPLTDMPQEVKIHENIRVVVKEPPKEEELPETSEQEVVEERQEIEEIPHEPEEIDILDVEVPELVMAPGPTELTVPEPTPVTEEVSPVSEMPPAQLDVDALQPKELIAEALHIPEPTPVNSNEVVAAATAQTEVLEDASSLMEQELRKAASEDGNANLPGDSRTLEQLMGETHLGSKSGVARLGADVMFGYDECKLKNSARITMLQLAALIQKNPDTYFLIEGHTDSIGGNSYNALLGLQRAAAVRAWLIGNDVPVKNVYIRSCGCSMPLAPTNGTKEAQALNRRVEIHMRAGGEELPAGACDHTYKVDLNTAITHQISKGVKIPSLPAFRLPVGASLEERKAAEASSPEPQKPARRQNRRR